MARASVTYVARSDQGVPEWEISVEFEVDNEHPDALDECQRRARALFTESISELRDAEDT